MCQLCKVVQGLLVPFVPKDFAATWISVPVGEKGLEKKEKGVLTPRNN
jgi:hypothetical protein